jgi:hypothetical protein
MNQITSIPKMANISYFEQQIQERVKNTSFRDFLKNVAGWYPVNFYKRDSCISVYPETTRSPKIITPERFSEQVDTLVEYGLAYDDSLSFFENYRRLFHVVPFSSLRQFPVVNNSDYTDSSGWWANNCYLDIGLYDVESVFYSFEVKENCKNVFGSVMVWNNCENVYQSNYVVRSSLVFYSRYILESHNIWFSTNLVGCHDCIYCDTLTNASYCIKNQQYTKEQYETIKEKMLQDQKWFERYYKWLPKNGKNLVSQNTTGIYITHSRDVENWYCSYNITNGKNTLLVGSVEGNNHMYNVISAGSPFFDHGYNVINAWWGNHMYCSDFVVGSNLYYCYFVDNCNYCLGCIWLKNQSYCILNKQYTKEEWEIKVCEIFSSMESDGALWDFFPASMNPFYFNDTAASIIDPTFSKEEVEKEGYLWRDEAIKVDIPEGMKVVKNTELDQFQWFRKVSVIARDEAIQVPGTLDRHAPLRSTRDDGTLEEEQWYIDPAILNIVISDEKWNYYRIMKMEYHFLMKYKLPLPTQHWLDRMKMGFCF